jgi:hypothetical protein
LILSDNTLVPPVTDDLSPPASRITGALSGNGTFIYSGQSFDDFTISRQIACFTNKTSPFFNSEELIFLISPLAKTCLAVFLPCFSQTIGLSFFGFS